MVPDHAGNVLFLWTLYFALAPMRYSGSALDLTLFKVLLIGAAATMTLAHSVRFGTRRVPRWPFGVAGLAVLALAMLPGIVQAGSWATRLDPVSDLVMAGMVAVSFHFMKVNRLPLVGLLRTVALVWAALALAYLAYVAGVMVNQGGVCRWMSKDMHVFFGHSNAAWSAILALALALFVTLGGAPGRWGVAAALAVTVVLAQVISGGRAGLMATGAVAVPALFWGIRRAAAAVVLLGLLAAAALAVFPDCWQAVSTVNTVSVARGDAGDGSLFAALNTLGTGRMVGYVDAVRMIGERPWTGWGWREVRVRGWQGNEPEVHNLYLKLALYCGVGAALAMLALTGALAVVWWRWWRRAADAERRLASAVGGVLLVGVLIAMVEPGALLGSFQYLSLWWAAAGIAMAGMEAMGSDATGSGGGVEPV